MKWCISSVRHFSPNVSSCCSKSHRQDPTQSLHAVFACSLYTRYNHTDKYRGGILNIFLQLWDIKRKIVYSRDTTPFNCGACKYPRLRLLSSCLIVSICEKELSCSQLVAGSARKYIGHKPVGENWLQNMLSSYRDLSLLCTALFTLFHSAQSIWTE